MIIVLLSRFDCDRFPCLPRGHALALLPLLTHELQAFLGLLKVSKHQSVCITLPLPKFQSASLLKYVFRT